MIDNENDNNLQESKLFNYIVNNKENIKNKVNFFNDKIFKLENENNHIDKKILEITKNIDITFEIFSPNSINQNNGNLEIEELKKVKNENEKKILKYKSKSKSYINEINEMQTIIDSEIEKKIQNKKLEENKLLISNDEKIVDDIYDISEKLCSNIYEKINLELNKLVDNCKYKLELCDKFINCDINRSKLEMIEMRECVNSISKKLDDIMFHVKHYNYNDKEDYFYVNLKKYIDEYNDNITDCKIECKLDGEDFIMRENDIINNIRIINEICDNSINHGKSKQINIVILSYDSNINEMIEEKNDLKELSQNKIINYEISKKKQYSVNIEISDDGCGFDLSYLKSKENTHTGGLRIVRQRLKKYNGKCSITSGDIGTVVKVSYLYEN